MTNNFEHLSKDEFEEIRKVYYSQAYDIVENLQELLLGLETNPGGGNALKTIKRHIHTLKGDSNSFGLISIGTLCHSIEDALLPLIDGSRSAEHEVTDLLLYCVDTINRLLVESESGTNVTDIREAKEKIDAFLNYNTGQLNIQDGSLQAPYTEYQELQIEAALKKELNIYRIEVVFHPLCGDKGTAAFMVAQRLNSMGQVINLVPDLEGNEIDNAKEITVLFSAKLSMDEIRKNAFITGITSEINISVYSQSEKKAAAASLKTTGVKGQILMMESSKVDRVMNLVGELIIGRSMIDHIAKDVEDGTATNEIASRLFAANSYMERTVSDLQKGIMKMRMVPVNYVFRRFPKIVRDLSLEKGKQARLDIYGRETELDKGIVDALGEPLAHIIRNLIDHGIESPACRKSTGKNEEGVVTLRAYHEAAQVVIEASDDGRGIDTEALKKKAVEKGFITTDDAEKLSYSDAVNLIFLQGLSTSETVNETSGRGIGMDAVKSAVEGLKGTIETESIPGKGTKFSLRLPLTLAVIKALLFEVGERLYAIPISVIAEVTRVFSKDLVTVDGRDTLMLRDKIISMIHLRKLFGTSSIKSDHDSKRFAITFNIGGGSIGLLIDRLAGQQELVIKAVDDCYAQSGLVSGASILGDGRVVLILNAPAIYKKAVEDEKAKITLPFIPSPCMIENRVY